MGEETLTLFMVIYDPHQFESGAVECQIGDLRHISGAVEDNAHSVVRTLILEGYCFQAGPDLVSGLCIEVDRILEIDKK